MDIDRLRKQIEFVVEIDKLKGVGRQTLLADGSRLENSAEHSWHIALMALVLSEHAKEKEIDLLRALKMVLIHDLVEIDAGDTYCYDEVANGDKAKREEKAADRLFNLLPEDQSVEFRSLWNEFESQETAEAKFAAALDRFQPLLNNYQTDGHMWKRNKIKSTQVFTRNRPIQDGAPRLWEHAERIIRDALEKGWLSE